MTPELRAYLARARTRTGAEAYGYGKGNPLVQEAVSGVPVRWRRPAMARYLVEQRRHFRRLGIKPRYVWEGSLERIREVSRVGGLPMNPNATDAEIIERANAIAEELQAEVQRVSNGRGGQAGVLERLEKLTRGYGIEPPPGKRIKADGTETKTGYTVEGRILRMVCPSWWRRQIRRTHARGVENKAIGLGFVHKRKDCYVSDESLARRRQQIQRNTAMLEQTIARNEEGDEYSLAELAARSTGNKAIRRGELMTRIRGFEEIAEECGHVAEFITVTAPSRMHARLSATGKGNPNYDGTTPKEAQAYLSRAWARVRAALLRRRIRVYGFRIAEPHHDGCPHWHLLLFFPRFLPGVPGRSGRGRLRVLLRRYFIGADRADIARRRHGLKFVAIEAGKGTAAGYVAKYVAKNIDGAHVGLDLLGNDAVTVSARVEAWASTHGIRQFQQIGGPPVGVWRELRRVAALPDDAPEALREAHAAVNKTQEGELIQRADWARFCRAMGGVERGARDCVIELAKEEREGEGRYGDSKAPVPFGVACGRVVARSVRHVWEIISKGARAIARVFSPWTRVNNCTGGADARHVEEAGRGGAGSGARAADEQAGSDWEGFWLLDWTAPRNSQPFGENLT